MDVEGSFLLFFECGELPIVGCKEGFGFFCEEVLGDSSGNRDPIIGAGASADFIEDDKRSAGGVMQDVGSFAHLDHEGRLAASEIIASSDAAKEFVDKADTGGGCWDKRADLGKDHDERYLANVGGLTGHVGACDEQQSLLFCVEKGVI